MSRAAAPCNVTGVARRAQGRPSRRPGSAQAPAPTREDVVESAMRGIDCDANRTARANLGHPVVAGGLVIASARRRAGALAMCCRTAAAAYARVSSRPPWWAPARCRGMCCRRQSRGVRRSSRSPTGAVTGTRAAAA